MIRKRTFISPTGAVLALICFFLPWGRFSCTGVNRTLTGAQIGGPLWIVFAAAVAMLLAIAAHALLRWPRQVRWVVVLCSLLALGVILLKQISFARGQETGFGRVRATAVGVHVRPGGAGTVLGLVVALAGSVGLGSRATRSKGETGD
jgi:hypothetical protein